MGTCVSKSRELLWLEGFVSPHRLRIHFFRCIIQLMSFVCAIVRTMQSMVYDFCLFLEGFVLSWCWLEVYRYLGVHFVDYTIVLVTHTLV